MRKKMIALFLCISTVALYPDVVAAKAVQVQEMWTAQKNW